MLLDGDRHVAQHGGAARSGDREQVRESRHLQAQVVPRPRLPRLRQREPLAARDAEAQQRPGHGVEPRREDDDVRSVLRAALQADARGGDRRDRVGAHVDQADVVAVVRVEVVRVDRRTLRRVRVVDVRELLGGRRVLHDLADLVLDELGGGVVRRLARQHVLEVGAELEAALLPGSLVDRHALVVIHVEGVALHDPEGVAIRRAAHDLVDLGVVLLHPPAELVRQRCVARRHAELRRALHHG